MEFRIKQEEGFGASGLWYAEEKTSFGWEYVYGTMGANAKEADRLLAIARPNSGGDEQLTFDPKAGGAIHICFNKPCLDIVDPCLNGSIAQENLTASAVTPEEIELLLDEAKKAAVWDGVNRRVGERRKVADHA